MQTGSIALVVNKLDIWQLFQRPLMKDAVRKFTDNEQDVNWALTLQQSVNSTNLSTSKSPNSIYNLRLAIPVFRVVRQ